MNPESTPTSATSAAPKPCAALARAKGWQRERALLLHTIFLGIDARKEAGETLNAIFEDTRLRHNGRTLGTGKGAKKFKLGARSTFFKNLKLWRTCGKRAEILLQNFTSKTGENGVPEGLREEFLTRLTGATGGRTQDAMVEVSTVYQRMVAEWRAGEWITGLGNWRYFYATHPSCKGYPMPDRAPDFPWSLRTFQGMAPSRGIRIAGNVGHAKSRDHLPRMELDYSQLRKCQLYTLDDVFLDLFALHEATQRVVRPVAYIVMEAGSRCIAAHILKPGDICGADVDEVLTWALQAPGFGIPIDGTVCKIKFERGATACTRDLKAKLEAGSGGRIQVGKTSMNGTTRWAGATPDRRTGNAQGKQIIESWMRSFHRRLTHLPGQMGNKRENAPANIGFAGNRKLYQTLTDPGKEASRQGRGLSETDQADMLSQFRLRAQQLGVEGWEGIDYPILTTDQLDHEIFTAIQAHNSERGHGYRGHRMVQQYEKQPGIWEELAGSVGQKINH